MTAKDEIGKGTTIIIFGASGDLTERKLIPGIFNMYCEDLLPDDLKVIGFARRSWEDDEFRDHVRAGVDEFSRNKPDDDKQWQAFADRLHYLSATFDDAEGYATLKQRLDEFDQERGLETDTGNRLFYLATPPSAYATIATQIGDADLAGEPEATEQHGWTRIIIEKPFGHDLESAKALNKHLLEIFDEEQVYRIDHYLGKETVQNILSFRLGNSIFEPLWNRRYIDHVQILVAEDVTVEGRGGYYDKSGAIRDMVQNHMLQVLSLIAMEPPANFNATAVRNEKVKVLQSLHPISPEKVSQSTARAQYEGYREEEGVGPDSDTETYVALTTQVDNWRWAGVPFYLRTGKGLEQRLTEVAIQFTQPPLSLFTHADHAGHVGPENILEANLLIIRIQPHEGIELRIGLKPPGAATALQPVHLSFQYEQGFGKQAPEAYERLLLDALRGDATLFIRRDETEAAWEFITPIIEGWESGYAPDMTTYEQGSWGPQEADKLLGKQGIVWRTNEMTDGEAAGKADD